MIPAIEPYLNDTNKILPFPGDMNATVDFLFTCFNNSDERNKKNISKKIISEWLLDFVSMNVCQNRQFITGSVMKKVDAVLCWDYDDVSDLHLK